MMGWWGCSGPRPSATDAGPGATSYLLQTSGGDGLREGGYFGFAVRQL